MPSMAPEPRRSARARPTPSTSNSTSKSSNSPPPDSKHQHQQQQKHRVKEEPHDHDHHVPAAAAEKPARNPRKGKQREPDPPPPPPPPPADPVEEDVSLDQDEEVTRCVCGKDNGDDGGLMIQCETCKVWQHGICVGIQDEAQCPETYFCESCRPDLHTELLQKRSRKGRGNQNSNGYHPPSHNMPGNPSVAGSTTRSSRSHSPPLKPKSPKRRSTMNSRDAAYDEALKQLIGTSGHVDPEEESVASVRRKRKQSTGSGPSEGNTRKRTRSASTASDQAPAAAAAAAPPTEATAPVAQMNSPVDVVNDVTKPEVPAPARATKRSRKQAHDGEEGGGRAKQPNQYTNRKSQNPTPLKRAPPSHANGQQDARRANNTNSHGTRPPPSPPPLYATWQLPDYLSHVMSDKLPSENPLPLEVRLGAGEEKTAERGVKIKWPSKRMTIGDMNKRARNIMEFVGREQASAAERASRNEALAKARKALAMDEDVKPTLTTDGSTEMVVLSPKPKVPSTMHLMVELMEDLILFGERYGPQAKGKRREPERNGG